jgi:DNA-binding NarL/FixJ family response regulator
MKEKDLIRLRIVEDDSLIREVLHSVFLSTEGVRVEGVHGSSEEILDASLTQGEPDVVVMDINLPGLSGIECVRRLSECWSDAQFLMYTVNDTDELVFEALRAGASGYLLKNSSPERIAQAVFELRAGGAPMSMSVARRVIKHFQPQQKPAVADQADLSPRESSVLDHLAQGLLYKEIADRVGVTEGAVKQHIHRIYQKLHVKNRTEAVNRYFGR